MIKPVGFHRLCFKRSVGTNKPNLCCGLFSLEGLSHGNAGKQMPACFPTGYDDMEAVCHGAVSFSDEMDRVAPIFIRIPVTAMLMTSEVPPKLMKGRVNPLVGTRSTTRRC